MTAFVYRAYRFDGTVETGTLEAPTKQDAARKLSQQSRQAFFLAPTVSRSGSGNIKSFLSISRRMDFGRLFSELAVLLNAGFTIDAALNAAISSEADAGRRVDMQKVLELITGGRPAAEAFSILPGVTPDVTALLASGERSARLAIVCQRLADSYEAKKKRHAAIVEALTYPAFLLVVMTGALVVLATVLAPALEPIFEGSDRTKPLTLTLLSSIGAAVTTYPFLFPAIAAFGLLCLLLAKRSPRTQRSIAALSTKMPLLGTLLKNTATAHYLDTLSLLLANGVPMTEALQLAANANRRSALKAGFDTIGEAVANGSRLHAAMVESRLFDNTTTSLVSLGEEANVLPTVLERAANLLSIRVSRRIDGALKLLTPILTVSLGLLVGSLVVSVMTTILSVNDLALR